MSMRCRNGCARNRPAPSASAAQWPTPATTAEQPPSWFGAPPAGTPAQASIPAPSPFGGYPQEPQAPVPGTLTAGQFVDDAALPGWLRAQGAAGEASAPMAPTVGSTGRVPAPGASAWSAPVPRAGRR